jgi:radical SAM protein with 4Fe4S-binding SPASM domain
MIPWINIELTNRCNKSCSFCGRAKARKEGALELGDMDIKLYKHIINQFKGNILQFNRDGETLLYNDLYEALYYAGDKVINIVTNGKLLLHRQREMIDVTTITVSVIEDDPEQVEIIRKFIEKINIPVIIKFLGDYYDPIFEEMGLDTMRRRIHDPEGDWHYDIGNYELIPELGICLDFLMKPSIDWQGRMYICNRYDPEGKGIIGDTTKDSLWDIWNGDKRREWLYHHMKGERDLVPLCKGCKFWGIPRYV